MAPQLAKVISLLFIQAISLRLLPETTLSNAKIIAQRLCDNVSKTEPGEIDGQALPKVTISLGVAGRQPGYTLDMMIAAADVAMYHAKRSGKNRVEIAAQVPIDKVDSD